jgi:hypothetical protein
VAPTQLVKLTLMLETRLEVLSSRSRYRENIASESKEPGLVKELVGVQTGI